MAGVLPNREIPYRKLSAGGILGFHAPYFSMPEGRYSKTEIDDAGDAMRLALLGLVRLSSRRTQLSGSDFIKKSLIVALLEKGREELSLVKTVAEAARWNIEIYDYSQQFPKAGNIDSAKNLCNNFHYSNIDEPVPADPIDLSLKVDTYASKFNKNDARIIVSNSRTHDTVCEIYPRTERGRPDEVVFYACSFDYWTDNNFGDCRNYKTAFSVGKYVPSFFTLAPATLLKRFQQ
jgi:hypothetical protein